jgi:hypothetical protein
VRPGRNWPTGFIHFPMPRARHTAPPAPTGRGGTIPGSPPAARPAARPAEPPAAGSGPDPRLRPR